MNIEKISSITLGVLLALSVVVFLLFALVGYDTPYEENPQFVDPQCLDAVLIWMYVLTAVTFVLAIISVIMQIKNGGSASSIEQGLESKTGVISFSAFVVSIIIGIVVGVVNKDSHLLINGKDWCDPTSMIITDASCISIFILMVITVIVTAVSMFIGVKK